MGVKQSERLAQSAKKELWQQLQIQIICCTLFYPFLQMGFGFSFKSLYLSVK